MSYETMTTDQCYNCIVQAITKAHASNPDLTPEELAKIATEAVVEAYVKKFVAEFINKYKE